MSVFVYGINFKTAPVEIREKTVLSGEKLESSLIEIRKKLANINEIFIVSTCNRTEFYYSTSSEASSNLETWLSETSGLSQSTLKDISYQHSADKVIKHFIRVASGLDSQVLGEPQILGQVKESFDKAEGTGCVGKELTSLFQVGIRYAKKIRSETKIGENPVSVAYAAVFLASKIFEDLSSKKALLIGAGETISLVTEHLKKAGIKDLTIANRTLEHAQELAFQQGTDAIHLQDIEKKLSSIDIIVSSTGSEDTILKKRDFEEIMKLRKRNPIFIVDIAVPRDIEASAQEVPNVYLYTIDHLTEVINLNIGKRQQAAEAAEEYVSLGSKTYLQEKRVRSGNVLIKQYRNQVESIRQSELSKIKSLLSFKNNDIETIENFSQSLVNKLTHEITTLIRSAIAENNLDLLAELKHLYKLESKSTESPKHKEKNDEPL